ncbi:histidine kinase dimerization/phosphoacceptor domain -containing protein [Mucilaginibacter sp. cycad4]|uniref:histidine kinase dimerization/phosphoacceptor domain -containing protein n=1 Tax=Mucilaginibacter sp. cycad4 TaxID=3342096 RepID=UPI002AAA7A99|nr:histidine kinase dimerization/phosphoacceptor domain -containing protein [Mucilaginibacter gossypii]WPV01685.1 histidine kinase dimerization/phosphoacceptor domain -containing protein [Mucilaginibacter gossypii]
MKKLTICVFLISYAFIADGQNIGELLQKLQNTQNDTNRINVQLQLGRYYLNKPGELPKDLDSSSYYLTQAETLSKTILAAGHLYRTLFSKGELDIEQNNWSAATQVFTQVANYYQARHEPLKEANVWHYYAGRMPVSDKAEVARKLNVHNKAYEIYLKNGFKLQAADEQFRIAFTYQNADQFDKAEQGFISVVKQYQLLKSPQIALAYYRLADNYYRKGDMPKELLARINCVNAYEAAPKHDLNWGQYYYFTLGVAYYNKRQFEQALIYHQKCVDIAAKLNDKEMYNLGVHEILTCYINLKKYSTAFAYLKKTSRRYPQKTVVQEGMFLSAELKLYNHMNNSNGAEKMIPRFKKVFQQVYKAVPEQTKRNYYAMDNFIAAYDPLPKHYLLTKQWAKLNDELKMLEALPTGKMSVLSRMTIYQHRFKVDSAKGDFLEALKGFQRLKIIKDSLNNVATGKQINELETKYLSVQKDKKIQELNNQSTIQKSNLEKIHQQRNITFAGVLIGFILAGVLYFAYRSKQRGNFKLKIKQEEINAQNNSLFSLLNEKEKLLQDKDNLLSRQQDLITEKEWLLREVHHRVKNNLQIVMSLLYTQSAYLQSTDARDAIRDSQNRVQAISIIHQKLYSKTNVATIVMADYITDLVRYLYTCYDCGHRKIRFKENLDQGNLDISQAVPMGLILNEAITNSIKYAFGTDGGEILIDAKLSAPEIITLRIADSGRGLPPDFNIAETSSLGMEMMKALSKQLGGNFEIKSGFGVTVLVIFKVENQMRFDKTSDRPQDAG